WVSFSMKPCTARLMEPSTRRVPFIKISWGISVLPCHQRLVDLCRLGWDDTPAECFDLCPVILAHVLIGHRHLHAGPGHSEWDPVTDLLPHLGSWELARELRQLAQEREFLRARFAGCFVPVCWHTVAPGQIDGRPGTPCG